MTASIYKIWIGIIFNFYSGFLFAGTFKTLETPSAERFIGKNEEIYLKPISTADLNESIIKSSTILFNYQHYTRRFQSMAKVDTSYHFIKISLIEVPVILSNISNIQNLMKTLTMNALMESSTHKRIYDCNKNLHLKRKDRYKYRFSS